VEEVLNWPWRRFEAFYAAFMKRVAIERIEERKDKMIAALWSNSNYDDDKGSRQNAIREIEGNFSAAVAEIQGGIVEDEIDENDPFFAPLKNKPEIESVAKPEGTVADNIPEDNEFTRCIDQ